MGFFIDQVDIGDSDVVAVVVDGDAVSVQTSQVLVPVTAEELDRVIDLLMRAKRLLEAAKD